MFETLPIKHLTPLAYLISIIIGITGFLLEFYKLTFVDMWFSRSGALICVMSVIFLLLTIRNTNAFRRVTEGFAESQKILTRLNPERVNVTVEEFNRRMDRTVDESARKEQEKQIIHEGSILIMGTVIWAFGDVLFKYFDILQTATKACVDANC